MNELFKSNKRIGFENGDLSESDSSVQNIADLNSVLARNEEITHLNQQREDLERNFNLTSFPESGLSPEIGKLQIKSQYLAMDLFNILKNELVSNQEDSVKIQEMMQVFQDNVSSEVQNSEEGSQATGSEEKPKAGWFGKLKNISGKIVKAVISPKTYTGIGAIAKASAQKFMGGGAGLSEQIKFEKRFKNKTETTYDEVAQALVEYAIAAGKPQAAQNIIKNQLEPFAKRQKIADESDENVILELNGGQEKQNQLKWKNLYKNLAMSAGVVGLGLLNPLAALACSAGRLGVRYNQMKGVDESLANKELQQKSLESVQEYSDLLVGVEMQNLMKGLENGELKLTEEVYSKLKDTFLTVNQISGLDASVSDKVVDYLLILKRQKERVLAPVSNNLDERRIIDGNQAFGIIEEKFEALNQKTKEYRDNTSVGPDGQINFKQEILQKQTNETKVKIGSHELPLTKNQKRLLMLTIGGSALALSTFGLAAQVGSGGTFGSNLLKGNLGEASRNFDDTLLAGGGQKTLAGITGHDTWRTDVDINGVPGAKIISDHGEIPSGFKSIYTENGVTIIAPNNVEVQAGWKPNADWANQIADNQIMQINGIDPDSVHNYAGGEIIGIKGQNIGGGSALKIGDQILGQGRSGRIIDINGEQFAVLGKNADGEVLFVKAGSLSEGAKQEIINQLDPKNGGEKWASGDISLFGGYDAPGFLPWNWGEPGLNPLRGDFYRTIYTGINPDRELNSDILELGQALQNGEILDSQGVANIKESYSTAAEAVKAAYPGIKQVGGDLVDGSGKIVTDGANKIAKAFGHTENLGRQLSASYAEGFGTPPTTPSTGVTSQVAQAVAPTTPPSGAGTVANQVAASASSNTPSAPGQYATDLSAFSKYNVGGNVVTADIQIPKDGTEGYGTTWWTVEDVLRKAGVAEKDVDYAVDSLLKAGAIKVPSGNPNIVNVGDQISVDMSKLPSDVPYNSVINNLSKGLTVDDNNSSTTDGLNFVPFLATGAVAGGAVGAGIGGVRGYNNTPEDGNKTLGTLKGAGGGLLIGGATGAAGGLIGGLIGGGALAGIGGAGLEVGRQYFTGDLKKTFGDSEKPKDPDLSNLGYDKLPMGKEFTKNELTKYEYEFEKTKNELRQFTKTGENGAIVWDKTKFTTQATVDKYNKTKSDLQKLILRLKEVPNKITKGSNAEKVDLTTKAAELERDVQQWINGFDNPVVYVPPAETTLPQQANPAEVGGQELPELSIDEIRAYNNSISILIRNYDNPQGENDSQRNNFKEAIRANLKLYFDKLAPRRNNEDIRRIKTNLEQHLQTEIGVTEFRENFEDKINTYNQLPNTVRNERNIDEWKALQNQYLRYSLIFSSASFASNLSSQQKEQAKQTVYKAGAKMAHITDIISNLQP
jgi:hypothetical protein